MWARELIAKGKKGLFLGQVVSSLGEENWKEFYHADGLIFLWGMKRAHMTDHQKIPDWWIKVMFFGRGWSYS